MTFPSPLGGRLAWRSSVFAVVLSGIACLCQGAEKSPGPAHDTSPLSISSFRKELATALAGAPVREGLAGAELAVAQLRVDDCYGPSQWKELLELRLVEQDDLLRRLWWSKDDRQTRVLIMALFWCARPPPAEGAELWPKSIENFERDSRRFAADERALRMEEARFVREHLAVLGRQLADALRDARGPEARALAERYAARAK